MRAADKLIFLGFAFHKQNMQLLAPDIKSKKNVICFASAFDSSDSDMEEIQKQITNLYSPNRIKINTVSKKCAEFFKHYWRSMSF